jgi:ribosomal protein S18 acetylase RimI-like enzyme
MSERILMKLALEKRDLELRFEARSVRAGDVQALGDLMYEGFRESVEPVAELPVEIMVAQETLEGRFGPLLTNSSLVVDEGGKLVAACLVSLFPSGPHIVHMVTRPERRGRGMGTELLLRAANALAEDDYTELTLSVLPENEAARRLYRRLGFEEAGRVEVSEPF